MCCLALNCNGSRVLFALPLFTGAVSSLVIGVVFRTVSCFKTVLQGRIDCASNYLMSNKPM